jgi:hypothetical protein
MRVSYNTNLDLGCQDAPHAIVIGTTPHLYTNYIEELIGSSHSMVPCLNISV